MYAVMPHGRANTTMPSSASTEASTEELVPTPTPPRRRNDAQGARKPTSAERWATVKCLYGSVESLILAVSLAGCKDVMREIEEMEEQEIAEAEEHPCKRRKSHP